MALYGSTIPLDHGGFVVTLVCPNEYSRDRLLLLADSIAPEAGAPIDPDEHNHAAYSAASARITDEE